jgi:hypothetical protein
MRCFFFVTFLVTHRVYVESFNAHTFQRRCRTIFATFDKLGLTNFSLVTCVINRFYGSS